MNNVLSYMQRVSYGWRPVTDTLKSAFGDFKGDLGDTFRGVAEALRRSSIALTQHCSVRVKSGEMRQGTGRGHQWRRLRLPAGRLLEAGFADSLSQETVCQTLKRTSSSPG